MLATFGGSLAAQENQDTNAPAELHLSGVVHTVDGAPVPGSTLRVILIPTGKAWVSWTDENGKFDLPGLPSGHYRIEVSQLGFAAAIKEIELPLPSQAPLELKLDVGTLAAINTPPAAQGPPTTPSASAGPPSETAKSQPSETAGANPNVFPAPGAAAANNGTGGPTGRRSGGPGQGGRYGQPDQPGGVGPGGGRRSFQQVGLNAPDQNNAENLGEEQPSAPDAGSQLGQAASADAVQMIGTVAMGQTQNQAGGRQVYFESGLGGPDAPGGFGNAGIPGQSGPPGVGGPGGGGFGGAEGGNVVLVPRGGGGGRGPGQRGGPPGGPPGIEGLMGVQRVFRQRVNRVHYSFYDTFGDSALNARPYSLSEPNPPKISGWTESAGLNIGGPLKIPHVYDGTDKTFFFINFGGTWSRTPVDSFATVPTAAERAGNFSNVWLYDPATGLPFSGCPQACSILPANPANLTPQEKIAQSLLNYIPSENLPGQKLNYHLQTNLPGLSNRLNVNIVHQISQKLSLQANYNLSNATSHSLNNFPGIEGNTFTRGQSAMIGLTQNYTKTFIHTSQFYFSRNRSLGLNEFSNLTDISSQLGVTGTSTVPFGFGLPQINFTNFTGLSDPNPSLNRSQTYRYVDSARWMESKHTVSVGGEIRKMDINRDTDPTPNGQFSFNGQLTSFHPTSGSCDPAQQTIPCGNDFADFRLGYPANTKIQYGDSSTYFRNWGFVGYATDDWHVVPKFTLTYGVRYEAFTPPTEINNHIVNLDVSPNFSQVQVVLPGKTGQWNGTFPRSLVRGQYNNWAPRLAIAWQPPGKWFAGQHQMTVRAGYGMFYVESYLNTLGNEMANQPPFAVANTLATLSGTNPTLLTLQNGFPSGTVSSSTVTNTIAVNPNYHVPYAMIWNASIEYNLSRGMFMEVAYTGTRGVHLDELLGFGLAHSTQNATGFTYDTSGAFSNFNALQVRFQKRMSHGLMFMARYSYSKSLDDASTIGGGGQTVIQNNANPAGDYGLSSFDMRHQFLGVFMYQLPFGDRQRFATKGWEKSVFGAWRVNGNFNAHSGTPYTVRVFSKNPACQNVPGVNSERADQAGSSALSNSTILEWFNTAAFSAPTGCFGDAPRNSVIGPGSFTINSGLSKTIPFGRDGLRRLDFSWNVSNLLNHVNYTGLSTVLGSTTFGQVTGAGAMRSMTFTTRVNF
jgi:hypothetical protein